MDWLHSYKSIRTHPKTRKLARRVGGVGPAVGLLHCLWWWAIDYAPDGDLTRFDPEDIAIACEWEGEPEAIIEALVVSGFLDRDSHGSLCIHDFHDHIGKYQSRAEADSAAKREARAKRRDGEPVDDGRRTDGVPTACAAGTDGVQTADATRTDSVRTPSRAETDREEREEREELKSMRDTKEQVSLTSTAEAADEFDEPQECTDVAVVEGEIVSLEPLVPDDFEEFWAAYPRKEGSRKKAAVTWRRLTREKRRLALGIATTMGTIVASGAGPERRFMPLPTTFLAGELWDGWREGVPANWMPPRSQADELDEVAREYAEAHGLEYAP